MTRSAAIRGGALVALVAGLAVAGAALPLDDLAGRLGRYGPVAALGLGTALLLALVPRTVITLACGALFGIWPGAGYALAIAMVAAITAFLVGRLLGRAAVREVTAREPTATGTGGPGALPRRTDRVVQRMSQVDSWLHRRGLLAVLVVRMLPVAPYGLVSYGYGATGTRARHYLLGTLFAAIPSTITYAVVGAAAAAPGRFPPVALLPAALGAAVSGGVALWWWRQRRGRDQSGT